MRQARLRTILDAIAAVHHGGAGSTTFRGDDDRGDFAHQDGSGNHAVLCWDAEGLVAAVFDHEANPEAGLPPAEWTPEVHFVGAPRSLDRLVARAIDLAGRMVTGSLWVTAGEAPRWDESGEGHEVLLDGMTLSPEEALFDGPLQQPWLELSSLDEGHGRLALRLAEASSQGPVTLGPEEVAIVLARPRRAPTAPDPRRMKAAAKILHAMGIAWEGPGDTKG